MLALEQKSGSRLVPAGPQTVAALTASLTMQLKIVLALQAGTQNPNLHRTTNHQFMYTSDEHSAAPNLNSVLENSDLGDLMAMVRIKHQADLYPARWHIGIFQYLLSLAARLSRGPCCGVATITSAHHSA